MRYIVVQIDKARSVGINTIGHMRKGHFIIINEKEVDNLNIEGSLEDKIKHIEGNVYSTVEMTKEIKQGDWKYGTNL